MVVGNGLIGRKFSSFEQDNVLIFASGVSNSKSSASMDFVREINLINEYIGKHKNKLFIYFSTYSIDDPDLMNTPYVQHKHNVEQIIKQKSEDYLIIRTSNIVGKNIYNPNTLLNYFFNKIRNGEEFECWSKAERNLLDIDHLYEMVQCVLRMELKNQTIYLASPICYKVPDIINAISNLLGKKPIFVNKLRGEKFVFDLELSNQLFTKLNINTKLYLENLLLKYYTDETKSNFNNC